MINEVVVPIMDQNNISFTSEPEDEAQERPKAIADLTVTVAKRGRGTWSEDDSQITTYMRRVQLPTDGKFVAPDALINEFVDNSPPIPARYDQVYRILDNGSYPFMVYQESPNVVSIYRRPLCYKTDFENYEVNNLPAKYSVLAKRYNNVDAVFPGTAERDEDVGNSVLLRLTAGQYVFIGDRRVYEFSTPNNDPILEYHSIVGNNAVPYPVAVGRKNVYFMLDRKFIPRHDFPQDYADWPNAYPYFYRSEQLARPFPTVTKVI